MDPIIEQQLMAYEGKLLGLIPPERIRQVAISRPAPEIIQGFIDLEDLTSVVADVLDQHGVDAAIPAHELKPIIPGRRIVGPAITLKHVPAMTTSTYALMNKKKALLGGRDQYTLAQSGDVLVIDASGIPDASNLGGLSATTAFKTGLAGAIVEGCVRDVAGMRAMGFPVWSRGITPRTGKHRIELAEFNGPVQVAGLQIRPGDLILADDDGIVVVPLELASQVLEDARKIAGNEGLLMEALKRGASAQETANILPPDKW